MSEYSIGIDLGTTNTVCCTINNGKFETIKIQRKEILPSVLLYKDGDVNIGEKARKRAISNANNYIKSSKTFMGDESKKWDIDDFSFTPTSVATEILRVINDSAKKHFKTDGKISAVITVPAYFTAKQKEETKKAGEQAGLNVKRIITEPVAAALAYGFEDDKNQTILVVDLGGGTFDVAILKMKGNVYSTLSVEGDSKLGGDDFDNVIKNIFFSHIRREYGIDLSDFNKSCMDIESYNSTMQVLTEKAEQVKIELSDIDEVEVDLINILKYKNELRSLSFTINREEFKRESLSLLQKIKSTIRKSLIECDLEKEDIDKVILVGGSTNIPFIKDLVKDELNQSPYADKDLSKLVAMGAALRAYEGEDITSEMEINDIVAHSLGTEVAGGAFSVLIPKGSKYPIEVTKRYTTVKDYQESVSIGIYEGEDKKAKENTYYADFELENIKKAKAGDPKIHITFSFDENQLLHVNAVDKATKSSNGVVVNIRNKNRVW